VRILHILHQYLPEHVGGTEHYTRTLALAQHRKGHQVTIFCRRSSAGQGLDRDTSDGIPIYRAVNGHFTSAGRFRSTLGDRFLADSMARVVRETRPHLIHIHHLMGLPAGPLATIGRAVPLVVTLHDYWWVCANAQLITDYHGEVCEGPRCWLNCARCGLARAGAGRAWLLSPLVASLFGWRALILRRLMPHVAAWIAPTAFVANWHTAHRFPAGRMHVVGHGIELPSLTRPEHPDGMVSHFAYIGGLSQQKGIHVLIDAFNALPASARLTVAGDESAFPDYCTALRARAVHPGIRFVGRLDRAEVWQTLEDADALVVPSLWYETSSLAIQEAFATGTPVVVADHGALSERVRHEVDGLLVPPGDVLALRHALARLMEEPGLAARLRSGIQPVTSIAEHMQHIEAIYQQVVAHRERRL